MQSAERERESKISLERWTKMLVVTTPSSARFRVIGGVTGVEIKRINWH